jgi:ATPase subunit of ABC transporter with duplicated ATPase domains
MPLESPPPAAGQRQDAPRLVADNRGLVATSLGKSFKKRPVLRDVNVSVQRGEAVGLLGPNGAGKTTCFYIITGLIAPDVGTITLDGHDITDLPMYRRARLGGHVVARDGGGAAVRAQERGEDPHRRRLAGAVRAEEGEHRAGLDAQVQPGQDGEVAERLPQADDV